MVAAMVALLVGRRLRRTDGAMAALVARLLGRGADRHRHAPVCARLSTRFGASADRKFIQRRNNRCKYK